MIFFIIIGLIFGGIGAAWANSKHLNPLLWGIVCFFTGFIGLIILAFQKADADPETVLIAGPEVGRWKALVEVDPEIGAAAASARAAGAQYEQLLAEKYLALNDKQYLPALLAKVLEEAKQGESGQPAPGA